MELRVAGAGGAVEIGGGEEAVAVDEFMAAVAAPGPAGHPLHVVERGGDRCAVGPGDLGGGGRSAERPGQRDRLRRREGEVEAGDRPTPGDVAEAERLAGAGYRPVSIAVRASGSTLPWRPRSRAPSPIQWPRPHRGPSSSPRRLRRPSRCRALLAGAELPDRQHHQGCPPGGVDPSRVEAIPLTAGEGGVCVGSRSSSTTRLSDQRSGCIGSSGRRPSDRAPGRGAPISKGESQLSKRPNLARRSSPDDSRPQTKGASTDPTCRRPPDDNRCGKRGRKALPRSRR
jgi:hypothetical protein